MLSTAARKLIDVLVVVQFGLAMLIATILGLFGTAFSALRALFESLIE